MAVNRSAVTRKLAAILIADVVGFSRHMERDDAGTFARLREIRERIVDPKIAEHGGRVVKTAGDGMLLEFGSADAALRCAIDVQRVMHADNQSEPADKRIEFRIGINLGDIIVDGTDIAGDGVNVASRLEALAEPGGICVSSAVREQVHGSLDVGSRSRTSCARFACLPLRWTRRRHILKAIKRTAGLRVTEVLPARQHAKHCSTRDPHGQLRFSR